MEKEKLNNIINSIKTMELKDKLRLGLCMTSSNHVHLKYNTEHMNNIFDKKLKEIDNEYLTTIVNMRKYPCVLFVMAQITELNIEQQNQIALYLFNSVPNLS